MAPGEEILTVGHSKHRERSFIELLRSAGVGPVVHVRPTPHSRLPHFNCSSPARSLQAIGIGDERLVEISLDL